MAKKTKKQLKIEQANMQSDAMEMGYSDGILNTGSDEGFTYSFSDIDNDLNNWNGGDMATTYSVDGISFDYDDKKLREKYPALQDAWNHYNNVKHMCEQKEKEDEV